MSAKNAREKDATKGTPPMVRGVRIDNAALPRVAPPKAKSENPTKPPGSKAQKSSEQSNNDNSGDKGN